MPDFRDTVGGWLLDLVGFIGLGLGGSQAAATAALQDLRQASLQQHQSSILSPAELASGVVKGQLDREQATREAEKWGLGYSSFEALVNITGNPPGPQELLEMWRRGIIDEGDVDLGLREGYTRNEWIEKLKFLRWLPLPVQQAVEAAVQNHLPRDAAETYAAADGVSAEHFGLMFQNAGNPPGPQELLDLWRRGDIDEATVNQGLRESRLKDKWIDPLKLLAVRRIPMRTVTTLVRHGALSDETAVAHLRQLGYTDDDARAIVLSGKALAAEPHRELSVATIKDLYAEHALSRDEAIADLVSIGYKQPDAGRLLDLADRSRAASFRRATIGKIRAAYTARHIARVGASTDLDTVGVQAGERDALLALWDLELQANVKTLTPAQIVHAGKLEIFTPEQTVAALVDVGYRQQDAVVLAMIGGAVPLPKKAGA